MAAPRPGLMSAADMCGQWRNAKKDYGWYWGRSTYGQWEWYIKH